MVTFTVVWNCCEVSKSDTFRLISCPNGILDRLDELITILPRSIPALINTNTMIINFKVLQDGSSCPFSIQDGSPT